MAEYEWKSLAEPDKWAGKPHGWIQWKGTNVCMDFHCECGGVSHIDAEFLYFIECGYCRQKYEVGGHVKMFALTDEEAGEQECPLSEIE